MSMILQDQDPWKNGEKHIFVSIQGDGDAFFVLDKKEMGDRICFITKNLVAARTLVSKLQQAAQALQVEIERIDEDAARKYEGDEDFFTNIKSIDIDKP